MQSSGSLPWTFTFFGGLVEARGAAVCGVELVAERGLVDAVDLVLAPGEDLGDANGEDVGQ